MKVTWAIRDQTPLTFITTRYRVTPQICQSIRSTLTQVVILVPFTSRRRWLQEEVNRQNVAINTWMQRLCRPQTGVVSSYRRKDLFHLSKLAIHCRSADRQSLWPNTYRSGNFPAVDAKWPIKAAVTLGEKESFALCLRTAFSISSDAFIEIGKGLWHFKQDTEAFWPR